MAGHFRAGPLPQGFSYLPDAALLANITADRIYAVLAEGHPVTDDQAGHIQTFGYYSGEYYGARTEGGPTA